MLAAEMPPVDPEFIEIWNVYVWQIVWDHGVWLIVLGFGAVLAFAFLWKLVSRLRRSV